MSFKYFISILFLLTSSLLWGYFEGKIYALSKSHATPITYILPIAFLVVSIIIYALGMISEPINLGLWVALWEIGAFAGALAGSTETKLNIFNEGVAVGWVFMGIGVILLTVGWDLLYGEYIKTA